MQLLRRPETAARRWCPIREQTGHSSPVLQALSLSFVTGSYANFYYSKAVKWDFNGLVELPPVCGPPPRAAVPLLGKGNRSAQQVFLSNRYWQRGPPRQRCYWARRVPCPCAAGDRYPLQYGQRRPIAPIARHWPYVVSAYRRLPKQPRPVRQREGHHACARHQPDHLRCHCRPDRRQCYFHQPNHARAGRTPQPRGPAGRRGTHCRRGARPVDWACIFCPTGRRRRYPSSRSIPSPIARRRIGRHKRAGSQPNPGGC